MQLIVVLAAAVGLLLVAGGSATAHPAAQEVAGDSELDDEMARKIIGSSVVTSVSVILNGQEPAHFTDAAGKPVPRPMVPPQVGSPINLLNPDRYEFYTFNDNGDLIKRLMTVKEIQSIVAGGAGEDALFPHHSSHSENQKIEDNVEDIVSNVQRVLNNEVDASSKRNETGDTHKLDTPDVSDTWSQILPAIFGNTGELVGPQPKPPQNIAMTTDAILMLNSATKKTPNAQHNRISDDDNQQNRPFEVSTPRSSFVKPNEDALPSGGFRPKTTESPVLTKLPVSTRAPLTKKKPPTHKPTTHNQLSAVPSPSTILDAFLASEKFVTSFSVVTTAPPSTITTDSSAYWAGIPITTDTIEKRTTPTTTPVPSTKAQSTSSATKHVVTSSTTRPVPSSSTQTTVLPTVSSIPSTTSSTTTTTTASPSSLMEDSLPEIANTASTTSTTTYKPTSTTTHKPTTTTTNKPTSTTTAKPITTSTTTIKPSTPPSTTTSTTTTPKPTTAKPISSTTPKPIPTTAATPILTTTQRETTTTTTTSTTSTTQAPSTLPPVTETILPDINESFESSISPALNQHINSDSPIINVSPILLNSPLRPKPPTVSAYTDQQPDLSQIDPMHVTIQKLSASLLSQTYDTTTYATEETTSESQSLDTSTENNQSTTDLEYQSENTSIDENTESLFDSDFSFNQIIESLKDSTDHVGLLLANDNNMNQYMPPTSTEVVDVTTELSENTYTSSDHNQLFVEESDPLVFKIATTTEESPSTENDTTESLSPDSESTLFQKQQAYLTHQKNPIVQQVMDFIDENSVHKIADSLAVESANSNVNVQVLPETDALTMSEYIEKAATVASIISRPNIVADKATRTSEQVNQSDSDDNVSYETSVVKETSSVSVSANQAPSVEPTLETNVLKASDAITEISVQSDVHEEVNMVHQHHTKTSSVPELNIAAEILNPIGTYDEEVIRDRFNELGVQIKHDDESSTESGSTSEYNASTTESETNSDEDIKTTTSSNEDSSESYTGEETSSQVSSTETSDESTSQNYNESSEGDSQADIANTNEIIENIESSESSNKENEASTTDSIRMESTTKTENEDSQTGWPSTVNANEDQTTRFSVSDQTESNLHNEPIFERIGSTTQKATDNLLLESSTTELNQSTTSSEEDTEPLNSNETTESSDEDNTSEAQNLSTKPVSESTEQYVDISSNTDGADVSYESDSTSSSSSTENASYTTDEDSVSTKSEEQSTTEFINSDSTHDTELMSSESRLGVESNEHLLVDDTNELMIKVQNMLNDVEDVVNVNEIDVPNTSEQKDVELTTITLESNAGTTSEPYLYQNDDPAESTFTTVSVILPKDEQVFINLGETTASPLVQEEITTSTRIESENDHTNVNDEKPTENSNDEVLEQTTTETIIKTEKPVTDESTETIEPSALITTTMPQDEQVFINLGETTTTETITTTSKSPPRKPLPETQHIIHIKKHALKVDDRTKQPTVSAKIDEPKKPMQYSRPQPGDKPPTAYIKMPPSFSSFKIKGSQASRKPALSVNLEPAPKQALGLEESTTNVSEDIIEFTRLCNELAFTFWKSATSEGISSARSLVIAPFALTSMLAMVFLGARGSTSGEMNELLRLDDMVTFNPHLIFRNITDSVENPKEANLANAAFVRALFSDRNRGKILPFFKEKAHQYYSGHVEEVNFNLINDIVRRRTNLLVKRQTFGKITEYLRTNNVWLNAPLAGLSANIFQTDCSKAFVNERDGEMFFQVLPAIRQRRLIPVPAVVWKSGFTAGYDPELDATAVAFGSASNVVSTIFVMPGQQGHAAAGDTLERLEASMMEHAITKNVWHRLLTTLMERPGLEVQIPRFSHRSFVNATHGLQKMGLQKLFDIENADLRGLTGSKSNDLYISDMVQINTFSTCGEEKISDQHHIEMYPAPPIQHRNINNYDAEDADSEAQETARTQSDENEYDELRLMGGDEDRSLDYTLFDEEYLGLPLPLRPRQARIPESPRLRFDKPFLFFVRHNPTGMILYMGRFNPRLLP